MNLQSVEIALSIAAVIYVIAFVVGGRRGVRTTRIDFEAGWYTLAEGETPAYRTEFIVGGLFGIAAASFLMVVVGTGLYFIFAA